MQFSKVATDEKSIMIDRSCTRARKKKISVLARLLVN